MLLCCQLINRVGINIYWVIIFTILTVRISQTIIAMNVFVLWGILERDHCTGLPAAKGFFVPSQFYTFKCTSSCCPMQMDLIRYRVVDLMIVCDPTQVGYCRLPLWM